MRLCVFFQKKLASTQKFYDIVNSNKERILPQTAQQIIISKYLKDELSTAPKINKYASNSIKSQFKQKSKMINYHQFMRVNPYGSIIEKDYKGVHFNLMSLSYQKIDLKQIYHVCEKYSPDLVFVQARPQMYNPDFQLIKKNGENIFSDKMYLTQLIVNPKNIRKNVISQNIATRLSSIISPTEKALNGKVYINNYKDIVEDQVVLMASYYAQIHNKQVMFGQLPQQPWRQWLCNSHTLMQLQQLFKNICKNIPFYQSLNLTPERIGTLLQPQIFLSMRDKYMATLGEMIVATKKYKKVLMIMGLTENHAVNQILQNGMLLKQQNGKQTDFVPILQYLIGPEIKSSILRDIEGWQIIQKHIIMDILHYGPAVMNQSLQVFETTNKIINHYGRKLNDYSSQMIMKFRFDKSIQYLDLLKAQVIQGASLKKKIMLRQAVRLSELDQ